MIKSWFQHSFRKSKTHSAVFGKLTEWKPENVWGKHGQPFAKLKLCDIWLACPKLLIFWCLQRQAQNLNLATVAALWLILAMFQAFYKFLKYICFNFSFSIHSILYTQRCIYFLLVNPFLLVVYLIKLYRAFLATVSCECKNQLGT